MPSAVFPPSLRLKEPQTKHTSLIPPERLQENSWQDFWRSHAPQGASIMLIVKFPPWGMRKILPRISVQRCPSVVRPSVYTVVNGSLDLAARENVLQAFLFHLAIQGAATEFYCAGQMHRTRDACAVGCHSFVSRVTMHRVE